MFSLVACFRSHSKAGRKGLRWAERYPVPGGRGQEECPNGRKKGKRSNANFIMCFYAYFREKGLAATTEGSSFDLLTVDTVGREVAAFSPCKGHHLKRRCIPLRYQLPNGHHQE